MVVVFVSQRQPERRAKQSISNESAKVAPTIISDGRSELWKINTGFQMSFVFVPLAARERSCSLHHVATVEGEAQIVYGSVPRKWSYDSYLLDQFPNTWRELPVAGQRQADAPFNAQVRFCPTCRAMEDQYLSAIRSGKPMMLWVTNRDPNLAYDGVLQDNPSAAIF
jgi:hypothetical protein